MNPVTLFTCSALVSAMALSAPHMAEAQSRGRAVPRGSVQAGRPLSRPAVRGPVRTYRPSYYAARPYYYRPGFYYGYTPFINSVFFYGRPGYFGGYGYGNPFWGYGPGYMPFGGAYAWGYGYGGYSGRPYGGVRIDLPQRDAEVFVDGYFVGTVNDFDGRLQQANLEAGPHQIEVREDGFEPITFDVNIEPGRTITYRSSMRPLAP